jgi:hypothetical protein
MTILPLNKMIGIHMINMKTHKSLLLAVLGLLAQPAKMGSALILIKASVLGIS